MDDALDIIWKALADPTRREILDILRQGSQTTGELTAAFPHLSRFGVMKHLDQLKQAQLVLSRKEGRHVVNKLNAVPIRRIYERWVSRYEGFWARKLIDVNRLAERQ